MEKKVIKTKEELLNVIAVYDWNFFIPLSKIMLVGDAFDDGSFSSSSVNELEVDGEALEYLLERDAEDEKRLAEINRLEAEAEEEAVTEVDVTEEEEAEPIDCYSESLPLPCGGVFKGDFYAPKKNQIKAANRESRRRKSTGRFHDDGSRWN